MQKMMLAMMLGLVGMAAQATVVPAGLPRPDDQPPATNKPVKVDILSGQSNMVGFGTLSGSRPVYPNIYLSADPSVRQTFEIPELNPDRRYRLVGGGSAHTFAGEGFALYVNGKLFAEADQAYIVNRRRAVESRATASPAASAGAFDYGDINPEYLPPSPWPVTTYKDPGGWTTIDVSKHGLKPYDASQPPPDDAVDAAEAVRKILAETKGRRRLYFPAGNYVVKSPLIIREGDIWLDGDGSDTTFHLDFPEGQEYNCIFFKGHTEEPVALAGVPKRGDASVELAENMDLKVGDLVRVYHDVKDNRGYPIQRGQICWVTAVDSKTVTLDLKIGADLAGECKLARIQPLRNVRCTNFRIIRMRRGPMGDHSLQIELCANAEVRNVESSHATTYNIRIMSCRDVIVTECTVHDYWVKKGYNGYGVTVENSSGVNVVNNRAFNLRHHFELAWGSSYCVAAYNVAEPTYDYTDVGSHHGDLGYCNLFEGNKCQDASFDWGESSWNAYNFFYRNQASRRVGSFRPKRSVRPYLVIIGNETPLIGTEKTHNPYVGANIVNGNIRWGDVPEGSRLPPSLFLREKPGYLGDQPWPLFGPPVDGRMPD